MSRFPAAAYAVALASVVSIASAVPAHAQAYDVSANFSTTSNPSVPFTYGQATAVAGPLGGYALSAFTPYTYFTAGSNASGTLDYWSAAGAGSLPAVYHAGATGFVAGGAPFQQVYGPGQVGLHPANGSGGVSVIRFTAPTAGTYALSSSFFGIDTYGTSTDVHVLLNGTSLFDAFVRGFGPVSAQPFTSALTLAAGDLIDFAVGDGGNSYLSDSTGLNATLAISPLAVSTAPEPSGVVLLASGLALLGLGTRRRRPA